MNTLLGLAERQQIAPSDRIFHRRMAFVAVATLVVTVLSCRLASIPADAAMKSLAIVLLLAMLAPLPLYWHEQGRVELRESTLVIAWEIVIVVMVPLIVLAAARSGLPLRDDLFAHLDQSLGVNVPSIASWASHHWLGKVLNGTYGLLIPLLAAAALAPAFMGKVKQAREFLLANIVAFTIGIAMFALLPAVGPWFHSHTQPAPSQIECQRHLLSLRTPGANVSIAEGAGVICFPSFHVIWAIFSAAALWGFRFLRIPVALLSTMIVLSTMTTDWHYFSDVLGGILVACISMAIAHRYAL